MQHIDEYMFFITNEGQIVREGSIAGPSTPPLFPSKLGLPIRLMPDP